MALYFFSSLNWYFFACSIERIMSFFVCIRNSFTSQNYLKVSFYAQTRQFQEQIASIKKSIFKNCEAAVRLKILKKIKTKFF